MCFSDIASTYVLNGLLTITSTTCRYEVNPPSYINEMSQLLSTLVKDGKIKQIYGVLTGHARAAPEGTWTQGGDIELPCKYKIYGRENCKYMVQNLLKIIW